MRFDSDQPAVQPKAAATLLVVRPAADAGIEMFCVRRHGKSAFLGGAVVFPGGKLDAADGAPEVTDRSNGVHARAQQLAGEAPALALAWCACRESLEEAALLPTIESLDHERAQALQQALAQGQSLLELSAREQLIVDTAALVPFARWITPAGQKRRYDTRFFLVEAPAGQLGQHDDHETTSSVWGSPQRLIDAFVAGDVFLAPPTLRCLELLATVDSVPAAMALADEQSLLPICPEVASFDPLTLVLPGDPEHSLDERRVAGPTRFVMDDGRLLSRDST